MAILEDGSRRLIETKGREDPDVAHKDCAAGLWCENATQLSGQQWQYLKVPQGGFDKLQSRYMGTWWYSRRQDSLNIGPRHHCGARYRTATFAVGVTYHLGTRPRVLAQTR